MANSPQKPLSWGRFLLIGGNLFIFIVLITQLSFPNYLTKKLLHMPIEQDISRLSSIKTVSLPASAIPAYQRLNRLHLFPKNFTQFTLIQREKALLEWRTWWDENRETVQVSGFNGLVFLGTLFSVLGLMGLVYLRPQTWNLTFLIFTLNSLAFFVLFAQFEHSSLGKFFAFSFMICTFTLGYLASPSVQEVAPATP